MHADPAVVIATKLKEAAASQYQADLGILVHVFRVDCSHLEKESDWGVISFLLFFVFVFVVVVVSSSSSSSLLLLLLRLLLLLVLLLKKLGTLLMRRIIR